MKILFLAEADVDDSDIGDGEDDADIFLEEVMYHSFAEDSRLFLTNSSGEILAEVYVNYARIQQRPARTNK